MFVVLNLEEFENDLDRWSDEILPEKISKIQLKLAFDLFAALVRLSPVDSGRYRGSWTMAAGSPDEFTLPEAVGHRRGDPPVYGPPQANDLRPATTWAALNVIWLANHLPYAERLEEGHSGQAPSGVAAPVLASLEAGGFLRRVESEAN